MHNAHALVALQQKQIPVFQMQKFVYIKLINKAEKFTSLIFYASMAFL